MPNTKVVIVGGGFGGLNVAKALRKADLDILIIDKTNHHLFQPLLYQVATAALSPGEIATPIREIFRNQENISVIMGDVAQVDTKGRKVILQNGDIISYDYLVLATGARHSYFGNDQWEHFAPGLKTIQDALKIREQVLISFEKAERMDRISESEKYLNFVVIGGGPTGVEMAGAIAEIANKTLFKNFRRIKPERSKIYLVEALPHILPMYPESLAIHAENDLKELGVRVITGKKVTNITEEGVQLEDEFIPSVNVVWAAGNQASPLLKSLDIPLDRAGRAIVQPDLTIPGHPEVFIIGDAAHAKGKDGKPLPGIAPTAIQQGKYVAKIIKKQTPKEDRSPFNYFDKGSMATIGTKKAIVLMGKFKMTGFLAWLAWCFIHIVYLIGFRNRFGVLVEWFYYFITGQRGVRLIYRSIEKELPPQR
ncbi:MAG: NAD(P)/FAD-dependent oxidoreductase [Verrucomicrobia bacterium]|nr:NAD(P)/FAD-dependent oxidoreductase [Verrucomicrobiota bacterium]